MRLLIAEDERDLAEALTVFLERNQFSVDAVHDGEAALSYATLGNYDGIILDVMMPKLDGIQVLHRLRQQGCQLPVMMLTAKTEKADRITGYDAGADDYLPKPFATDELLSRIRAMLRRRPDYTPSLLTFSDLQLDCRSCILYCGEASQRLSGREYQVMELFMRSPRAVLSPEQIIERVWGWNSETETSVLWVHISNLRKKLKSLNSRVSIRANRGLGYLLEENHA